MGKQCKNCNKPNHFARMCHSQQVNEITETRESSEEECNLMQTFVSCEEFEIMSIEQNNTQMDKINRYIEEKMEKNNRVGNTNKQLEMRNFDIRRDQTSERMKSLKALV